MNWIVKDQTPEEPIESYTDKLQRAKDENPRLFQMSDEELAGWKNESEWIIGQAMRAILTRRQMAGKSDEQLLQEAVAKNPNILN